MIKTIEKNGHTETAKEYRQIKITSKRQFTIPKSFFDSLDLAEGVTMNAYLLDDEIILKPAKKIDTIQSEDYRTIIDNVIAEGYKGDRLANEIAARIDEYDKLIAKRIQEFENDIDNSKACEDDLGDEELNGLEIFLDSKDGANCREVGKTKSSTL